MFKFALVATASAIKLIDNSTRNATAQTLPYGQTDYGVALDPHSMQALWTGPTRSGLPKTLVSRDSRAPMPGETPDQRPPGEMHQILNHQRSLSLKRTPPPFLTDRPTTVLPPDPLNTPTPWPE